MRAVKQKPKFNIFDLVEVSYCDGPLEIVGVDQLTSFAWIYRLENHDEWIHEDRLVLSDKASERKLYGYRHRDLVIHLTTDAFEESTDPRYPDVVFYRDEDSDIRLT